MNVEASLPEGTNAELALVEDLKGRLQGAQSQEIAARAEARRLMRELSVARRLLRFFVNGPPPARSATAAGMSPVSATLLTGDVRFHLDACQQHGAHTAITGWAFCPVAAWDGHLAEIVLIFRHGSKAYFVPTGWMPRPDIAAHFALQPTEAAGGARGLDGAGFACEILNDSLPAGVDLEIVLRLECEGLACERSTGQRLRL